MTAVSIKVFSSAPDAVKLRRPTDIVLIAVSVLGVVGLGFFAPGPTAIDEPIAELLAALPGLAGWLWELSYALLAVWALVIIVIVALSRGRRWMLVSFALAAALAVLLSAIASTIAGTPIGETWRSLLNPGVPPVYLAVRVAVAAAILVTASPYLSRSLRVISRAIITLGAIAGIAVGVTLPIGAVAGILIGSAAAAGVHLILGSPGGHPTPASVAESLAELGAGEWAVTESARTVPGVAMFAGANPAADAFGDSLLIKVYARDAWDDQWLTAAWSSMMRRGEASATGTTRLQKAEHEAVVTLLAERAGVPVLPILTVGEAVSGDVVLVSEARGRAFADLPKEEVTDQLLASTWQAVLDLHGATIAHGRLDGFRIVCLDDGSAAIADLGASQLAAPAGAMLTDNARLLVATAIAVGHERAIAAAVAALSAQGVAELLPYLQPAVLDRPTRKAIHDGEWSLKDLTAAAVEASGVEPPKLEKIQRVTVKSVTTVVLITVLAYALLSKIAGADLAAIWTELASADFWWLAAALIITPTIPVAMSFSTLGSSLVPLRYFPVLMLQYAILFIGMVLPANAARFALEVRFFERFGIPGGRAVSMGAVDALSGLVVQIALILLIALTGLPGLTAPLPRSAASDTSDTSTSTADAASSSSTHWVLLFAILLIVAGLAANLFLPKVRARTMAIIPNLRRRSGEQLTSAKEALVVLKRPGHVAQMIAGNFAAQLLQAIILGLCLTAFGFDAALTQLILINTLVSLFAGLMPVPGGMGVAEAGYTAGLQAIGIPPDAALSTAIAFRLITFYLPPLWGSFAMRWLRRNSYA